MSFQVLTDFNKKTSYKMKKVTFPIYRSEYVDNIKTMALNKQIYESLVSEYQKLSNKLKQLNEEYNDFNILLSVRKKCLDLLKKSFINKLFKYAKIKEVENYTKEFEELLENLKKEIDDTIWAILFNEKYKTEYYENFLKFQRRLDKIMENLTEIDVNSLINYYSIDISKYSSNENIYDEFEISKKMLKDWLLEIKPSLLNQPIDISQDYSIYDQVTKKLKKL